MKNTETSPSKRVQTSPQFKRLLFVAPKPPPIGGSPLTVQAMLEELTFYPSVQVRVINTSPATDVSKKMDGFKFEKVSRSLSILPRYLYEISRCDAVLVFANDLFAVTLVPLLLFLAKLFRKPFYLKPVGASLDLFLKAQKKVLRNYLLFVLRGTDGILTQTRLLKEDLNKLGCTNARYLPGCRTLPAIIPAPKQASSELRLIFLAHIIRPKGPLVLLDALKIISESGEAHVKCDFYGPIIDDIREEFLEELKSVPIAHYCGIAEAGTGAQLISQYDVLVLPTYYDTEGHPGVLIEAMHAGVPVLSTLVRTFPELITNGKNGFLVPPQDSHALAEAIVKLALDPQLRERMGQANHLKGQEFQADKVVEQMLKTIFPSFVPLKHLS
jgi:glycosyltransferase involved in cell wall biosynthesis